MSTDDWIVVDRPDDLSAAIGVPGVVVTDDAYRIVTQFFGTEPYLQLRLEKRSRPDEMFHYEVGRTRLWFNWSEAKKVGDDAAILAIVYLSTQNLPLTTLLGLAKKVRETFTLLTVDETEVVRVVMGIAAPASAYEVGVPEARVKAAYRDATVGIDSLLDSLQSKKVLRLERPGKVRLIA